MTELAGRLLGRYRVVSQIGAGGMGEVYRARDSKLDRDVAIKVLPDGVSDDADRRQRFEREARVVAQLSHPNILEIHDFGSDEGRFYAVTELLTGQDLRMEMTGRRLRLDRALEIGIAIAEGLGSAHSKGVIHRDIKPSNIFLTQSGQVKILDFGIARLGERSTLNETESSKSTLTAKGTMIGTVGYMAPEQVRGDPADARSDIFSLGCVLYEMFTGKRPFSRETTIATLTAILNKDPSPITTHNPDLPPALDQIVARCLRKEPGRRFESARDVAFSLKALTGVRTSPMRFRRLSSPRLRRQSAAAAVGAAVVVVSLFGWKLVNRWLPGTPVLPIEKHVAVIGFEAPDDSSGVGELAIGLTRTVTSGLSLFERGNLGQFWVVPPHQAEKFGASTVTDYYRKFNVTVAVTGELSRRGELLRLELGVVDAATGRRLRGTVIEDSVSNVASFQEQPVVR
ncbi:MAG: serine/threonine protein kinase, partial [bacterium]|nr:serine/threonine protein kinase [bacterium]